jgi:molybdopterin molybdotransferase
MDGYAVASACTRGASAEKPLALRVEGIIAAGDSSVRRFRDEADLLAYGCFTNVVEGAGIKFCRDEDHTASDSTSYDGDIGLSKKDIPPCVEIMTGARFPPPFVDGGKEWVFDACVRLEDVTPLPSVYLEGARLIQIKKPVLPNSHRRRAGEDFAKNDLVVEKGQALQPQHVTALASLGISEIAIFRRLRIAILSTGEELVPHSAVAKEHLVKETNGPFLETALRNLGVEAQFWGVIGDECGSFVDLVSNKLRREDVDVVISTGAVSMGRFDFVEAGLDQLGGGGPLPSCQCASGPTRYSSALFLG